MTMENQESIHEENASEPPLDSELFASSIDNNGIREELSERDVFAGDEDFYRSLADSTTPTGSAPSTSSTSSAGSASATDITGTSQLPPMPITYNRFSNLQKILIAGIVVIVVILMYASLKSSLPRQAYSLTPTDADQTAPVAQKSSSSQAVAPTQQTPPAKQPIQAPTFTASQQAQQSSQQGDTQTQPLSLKLAQNLYLQGDYEKAYDAYNQLCQRLQNSMTSSQTQEQLLKDFLQLKMALCMEKTAHFDQANRLFRTVSTSRSPAVNAVANYHLCLLEMQKKQYQKAQTRAYRAIALIDAADFERDWALLMQHDCHFLIAQCLTRDVLSLGDADKDFSEDLWSNLSTPLDPFTKLSELQLRSLLISGSEQLSKALLGPQIQKLKHEGTLPRWSVTCNKASIEELLVRFAANADLDIHWQFSGAADSSEEMKNSSRQRPVTLYIPAATAQQFINTAVGCAGLMAHLDNNRTVNIFDPTQYSSLSQHLALLSQQAVSLWQNFLLTFHNDQRVPNAHFALALLQLQKGRPIEAIAEYKLVANRFSETPLAPLALLNSSKLKTNLRDYSGARQDLLQLVELYPDTEIAGQACLYLADATMKAELYDEAERLYRKVYNLGLSLESQTAAALGAGRCFYEKKDYQTTVKWLTRYINLAKDRTNKDWYSALFLLGKTNLALGKYQQACDAFQHALAGQLSKEEYVGTISTLVKAHIKQEHFVQALDILENIPASRFSQKESTEILLLKSRILRQIGLADKAASILGERVEYVSDPQLKAKISLELANCHITKGNLELARRKLTEILILVEPGPLAHEIVLKLADVCLKLDQNSQAISICSQLLDLTPPQHIKQKALVRLATAYNRQKNYDRAALALLGRWNKIQAQ